MSLVSMFLSSKYKGCVSHQCPGSGCGDKIERDGAAFNLNGAPAPHILVDCDAPPCIESPAGALRCDYIFVADDEKTYIAPVEMTSGKKKLSEVVSQLQFGADLASRVVKGATVSVFQPVFVGELKDMDRREWARFKKQPKSKSVEFRGERYPVEIIGENKRRGKRKRFVDALSD